MCYNYSLTFECFCDSRVIENLNRSNDDCACKDINRVKINFGWCYLCSIKLLQNRRKLKNVLLTIQSRNFTNMYFNNSVNHFVERKINC